MGKNLKGKTVFIIAVLVIFVYGIFGIPTHGVKDALLNRIHLGLDLQGGTHLVLKVHVEEAVNSATDRDMQALNTALQPLGAQAAKTDLAHPEVITVTGGTPAQQSAIHDVLTGTEYAAYDISSGANGSYVLTMKEAAIRDLEARTLQTSIETIRERVDSLGVSEPVIEQYGLGDNEILVELPGVTDLSRVENIIQSTAKLEIHAVVPGQGPWPDQQQALAALGGTVPPDEELVQGNNGAGGPDQWYLLKRASIVEGTDFRGAQPSTDQNGQPDITFTLTTEAGDRFYKYTSANVNTGMAIVLENKVKEVANIESAIRDSGEIHGGFSQQQANDLSLMLRTGSLPASISYLDTNTVGPSLGKQSIHQGVVSAIAGMAAVLIFMLIYYRGAGINADLALILNLVILLGFMGFSHATLTLPGIAGVILTIGMGVDSNVLIFERIREELRAGKTSAAAVHDGFGHAWITILDTHITTIVSAAILFIFGTGPVKGFAVTLTFGLLANLFTAVFVSRVIFDALLEKRGRAAVLSI
ncbi:MAG TPA: protein translocase subunit SecD [Acidobacteriaceae bacterium]|nr:protein translocase subunit SecD [Acidobacteriaceae bacterium]